MCRKRHSLLYACSLDDPIATDARERKIESVIHDPGTNEIAPYRPRRVWVLSIQRLGRHLISPPWRRSAVVNSQARWQPANWLLQRGE